jgi:hypothetical protein
MAGRARGVEAVAGVKLLPSARERQVRRALAAERARRRRDVDAEVAMYRTWVLRAIPWVAGLNVAMMVFLIWRGMPYAITANITVLPLLWLARWTVRLAEARDARPDTAIAAVPDDLASWLRAIDVEHAAGDLTDAEYAAERQRYEKIYADLEREVLKGGGLPPPARAERCAACNGPLHPTGRHCTDPTCTLGVVDDDDIPF